ncbi:MAG: sensor histidine kinase [Bacteroidia bacterium]
MNLMFVPMQKRMVIISLLMTCCVLGITGLQLYWNYQSYKTTTHNFEKDSKNALDAAVDREIDQRLDNIVGKAKIWLADTSFVQIECNINNRDQNTVFTVRDVHPRFEEDSSRKAEFFDMGINDFHEKLHQITPAAKKLFINHFTEKTLKYDLADGNTYYYTQGLGDSLTRAINESKFDPYYFKNTYKSELAKRGIFTAFQVRDIQQGLPSGLALSANTAFRRPYKFEPIFVSLASANQYYWKEMKGLMFTSLMLIAITVCCFYYTIKTLFNQHKLAAIKNQFISNMTHEISTPLSSIQITAEALQHFNHDKATTAKYLDIILHQTNKLNELTQEILESAKLESQIIVANEMLDLNLILLNIMKELNTRQAIQLRYVNTAQTSIILGNKSHLSRSIANIIENAIKYNLNAEPVIEIGLTNTAKTVDLTIKDNGTGIADEFKNKVFEQFYRIPTGNIHNIKGYGLGLSYVKKVILQHKGSIHVLDNKPNGSIFAISLPR